MSGYENGLAFTIYVSDQKFEDSMDLMLLIDDVNRIMCTSKIFTDLCFTKLKKKHKKWFCRSCLQCFSGESVDKT